VVNAVSNRIERLPDDLVNKIAAGEVVERPASVVKELVENALDAQASNVNVEIEAGGKSLVRVRDDGHGMGRINAERALERHATSKLRALPDLQSLATHGFRGEALPSIASVSHLVLTTREEGDAAGTEVEVRHGQPHHVRDAGHPRGTTVEVRDLFGAVPARRKFLRADSTEAGHVAEAVTLLALARPDVGFSLTSGGRSLLRAPAVNGLASRLYQVFGGVVLEGLVPVDGGEPGCHVSGFVSRPDRPGLTRSSLRLFVNRRTVRDRALAKAVAQAYRGAGAGDRPSEAFLLLDVPSHMVDVNVHPAKTEVRFADPRTVWTAVERAVRQAIALGVREAMPRADTSRVAEAVETYVARAEALTSGPRGRQPSGGPGSGPREGEGAQGARGGSLDEASTATDGVLRLRVTEGAPATVLGPHRNTYIVCTDGENLILVDQHTAHERVRFEHLLTRMEQGVSVEAQLLLTPVVVIVPPDLLPLLEEHADELSALGFDAEAFGGGAARLRSVPTGLRNAEPGAALTDLLRDYRERESAEWLVSGARERLAATVACHSSVRAGQPLARETMQAIVADLARTEHPTLCPHGRPTVVRIPREDVSRWFGRSGWRRQ